LVIALVAAAGVALRVWVYRSALGDPDSDEAIVGLMARHILHGGFTTFYWGQPYGGPQEAWLTAPVFAVAGPSLLALRTATLVLTAVAVWLVWRVGLRTIGARAAAAAAALFWLWPPFDGMWLVHERGFYASDVVYCALLLLLGLRIVEAPTAGRVGVFGLVLGLGFWETAQIVPVAVPTMIWVAWRAPQALRRAWAGLFGATVGALPWLVWNARHDWASVMPRASAHQYFQSLRLFVSPLLPMLLGLRAPFTAEPIVASLLMYVFYVALLAAFAYGAWRARHTNATLLYAVAICFPFIWAISRRVVSQTSFPIYLVVVSPVVVLLLAQLVRRPPAALALLAVACAVTVVTLHRMEARLAASPDHSRPPRSFAELVRVLDAHHVTRVFADYWIAYRLTFATQERIVAAVIPAQRPRWLAYQREVAAAPEGYVLFRGESLRNPQYRRTEVGSLVVLDRH
jgi:4-amino-4-deoxy-L-arabinose transferase-like glycosyltransferase